MKKIEELCAKFRKGTVSENEFRIQLIVILGTLPGGKLSVVAERLQYNIEGGDG